MVNWIVDKTHSEVGFEVRHMMVSKVRGTFDEFEAEIIAADLQDLTDAQIKFTISAASVNTRNEERDNHLRSADFFNVEETPNIDFLAKTIKKSGDDYKIYGDLTMNGITQEVKFKVEFNGQGKNPWGVDVYGFEVEAKINREDFGLTWNAALETGGVLVGKEVKIKSEFQLQPAE